MHQQLHHWAFSTRLSVRLSVREGAPGRRDGRRGGKGQRVSQPSLSGRHRRSAGGPRGPRGVNPGRVRTTAWPPACLNTTLTMTAHHPPRLVRATRSRQRHQLVAPSYLLGRSGRVWALDPSPTQTQQASSERTDGWVDGWVDGGAARSLAPLPSPPTCSGRAVPAKQALALPAARRKTMRIERSIPVARTGRPKSPRGRRLMLAVGSRPPARANREARCSYMGSYMVVQRALRMEQSTSSRFEPVIATHMHPTLATARPNGGRAARSRSRPACSRRRRVDLRILLLPWSGAPRAANARTSVWVPASASTIAPPSRARAGSPAQRLVHEVALPGRRQTSRAYSYSYLLAYR